MEYFREKYVYVSAFIAHISAFMTGTSMSWGSPMLVKLINFDDNPLGRIATPSEQSWLGSTPTIGSFFGCFLAGYLAKKYGRKPTLVVICLPMIASNLILAFSTSIGYMYIARIISGLTIGAVLTVEPMYSGEIATNNNRGFLGAAMTCFINFGLLFSVSVGPFTTFFWFHIILTIFPVIYTILAQFLLIESPHYLVKKDLKQAEVSLSKLRVKKNKTADVKIELYQIKEFVENETNNSSFDLLHNKGLRKGLIIGCGLMFFQQFSGASVIVVYGQLVFSEAGDFIPSEFSPIIVFGIQNVFGFISPSITDKSGRKILLLISYMGITVSTFVFGTYFFLDNMGISTVKWIPLISMVFFTIFYSIGAGPLPWTVVGELFPLESKATAASICTSVCLASSFVVLFCFNWIQEAVGMGPTFWIFSVCGMAATIFTKILLIETRAKSLEEIQEELNS